MVGFCNSGLASFLFCDTNFMVGCCKACGCLAAAACSLGSLPGFLPPLAVLLVDELETESLLLREVDMML